uniref:UDP-N-acetylglucosamine 1-carboxyvinyltransferase n=1 Tax=Glossina palpalis gambiensis TaxID=67801 RepID=A0A1B0C144_9MUSC
LAGPNGAGKTTTFYIIAGVLRADQGSIILNNKDISRLPLYARVKLGIGYLPQEPSILLGISVLDNLMIALQNRYDLNQYKKNQLAQQLMEEFKISHIQNNLGYVLSGGEKRTTKLSGDVIISGAKNSSLPILFATILSEEEIEIQNVPKLKDIEIAINLLKYLGAKVEENKSIYINARSINIYHAPCQLAKTIRASIWILGPLLARFGEGKISLPGGCAIGSRPVDLHIDGLKKLGAKIYFKDGYVKANVKGRLHCAHIVMKKSSVGATVTIMSAATLAIGMTVIENAAREPEVIDTANFLILLGAKIHGLGTKTIIIQGVKKLRGGVYRILPDRIETGTFLVAGAVSRGKITCYDTNPNNLNIVLKKLYEAGAKINIGKNWITLDMCGKRPRAVKIKTEPYPGFPTDMQAQFTLLNLVSQDICFVMSLNEADPIPVIIGILLAHSSKENINTSHFSLKVNEYPSPVELIINIAEVLLHM